ncbi:Hypp1940 [Branchiostoma lanceolatum]|uniref:Hypp1940 protein n=1 Tax=Branchiostoma lanceolatum TaxID=7740 RepID=A0A8J9ZM83_BRALA|nr:Hypp1940 [Branchiostoma lanceolatum]
MLDTMIHRRPDGTLYATVYRKPTHTDLYLNFASHHPLQHKIGAVRTLTDRANVIVTEESDKTLEIEHIHNALSTCGYPDWLFHVSKEKRSKRTPSNKTRVMRRGTVSIPYIKGISETLMRLYRSKGMQCQFKPINTIRRNLVAPKDKIKKPERSGTVYHIPCADCPATYVGESERPLSARLQEHKRASYVSSPVVQDVAKQKHKIDWDNVKVLDQDSDWFSRGVREAIQICRQRSTLNRDRGRHYLKPV